MAKRTPDPLITPLRSVTPATFEQLQAALGDASRATTFRYLKQVPYLRSYNHNGRYYTYRDPTRFDRWGLASLGNVHFSRDRTLAATVKRLIRESAAGWTQKELQALLRVRVQVLLLTATRQGTYNESEWAGSTSIFTATRPSEKPSGASVELNSMRILPAPPPAPSSWTRPSSSRCCWY